jgi:nucleotide-binding universal stress UspA family protein
MSSNSRILIAVDKSDASHKAVNYVADIASGNAGLRVGLLHLELPPRMLEWGGSEDPKVEARVSTERAKAYHEMETNVMERSESLLHRLDPILAEKGIDVTAELVQFEEPLDADTITNHLLECAREQDYGTVVIGRHAFVGLRRMFQSDVAEQLLDKAKGLTVWIVE